MSALTKQQQNCYPGLRIEYKNIHKDIVAGCRQGNRRSQQQLYQLYAKAMFNIAHRILNTREEAEDILQDAFVDVFTKLDSFRGDSSIGAWIKRIVINKSINAVKKKRLLTTDLEVVRGGAFRQAPDVFQEEESTFPYTVRQVQDAIERLPDGYRVVFSLYLFEGYSHKEIASELGISESTSKSQFSRAKRKVRQLVESG